MSNADDELGGGLSRRDLLRLAGGLSTGMAAGVLMGCSAIVDRGASGPDIAAERLPTAIDYDQAIATPTICFGCTTHCGVIGWVQDGRVRKIDGNPLDPNSQGTICSKAQGMISYTYYPERLLYPLRRVGKRGEGRWQRISWDEALGEISARMKTLREAGTPEHFVFHYGRDKTKGFTKRFTDAFGTPHRLNRRSICSSNRRAPLMSFYGREFEWESQDFANTKFILNFGANVMEAHQGGLFTIKRIMDSRIDNGAKLVTFEIRPSATASVSDEFYSVTPASDGAIALAMANVIIDAGLANREFWDRWANYPLPDLKRHIAAFTPAFAEVESGVPASDIERLAIEFAKAAPACTTLSNRGSAKHYNGVQADRAIRMLDVLVGNVGRPGGFCLSSLRMWKNRYGQEGLPVIDQPEPKPGKLAPWKPGTREFELLPSDVQRRVAGWPEDWQNRYFGELATPSEYVLSWHWYPMRVGQLVPAYIKEGRQKVGLYMSYTLGASFGFPEANLNREVLMSEELIPFHVAIDINYSEQAALADLILPDATSLERWDAHATNNYGLRPYTGIRQPLVEPLGEARSVQVILRDLAHRIGGGMERYFAFDDPEDYYRQWYEQVPLEWEELKRRGIWFDPARPLDYRLYERPVPSAELAGSEIDEETQVIYSAKEGKKQALGIMQDGQAVRGFPTPTRRIQVFDSVFPLAARHCGVPSDDINASSLPTYDRVPEHKQLGEDEYIFTTFKWNVHTQGRSAYWKYHAEIVHTNPAFISPKTGKALGLRDGDEIEITTFRPKGHVYRAGEKAPVGSIRKKVRLLPGMHGRVVACAHHAGHWEHGTVARAGVPSQSARDGMDPALRDDDIADNLWWAKSAGGPGCGEHINDVIPINAQPLVGGQNWFDTVCRIRRTASC